MLRSSQLLYIIAEGRIVCVVLILSALQNYAIFAHTFYMAILKPPKYGDSK
jgi:hypothetical protein